MRHIWQTSFLVAFGITFMACAETGMVGSRFDPDAPVLSSDGFFWDGEIKIDASALFDAASLNDFSGSTDHASGQLDAATVLDLPQPDLIRCDGGVVCTGECVDTANNVDHCGGCGNACLGGWNCCQGLCRNPVNDLMNCGGCGVVCKVANGFPVCQARQCRVGPCFGGFADCNGVYMDGCETDLTANLNHCGGCNQVCSLPHAQSRCVGGVCQIDTCLQSYRDCNQQAADGCELDVKANDPSHCGGCNQVCRPVANGTVACTAGVCTINCRPGYTLVNGACVQIPPPDLAVAPDLAIPPDFAVPADLSLPPDLSPLLDLQRPADLAVCQVGLTNCSGKCFDLQKDVNNCGACGMMCLLPHATAGCLMGICVVAGCDQGWSDCDRQPGNGCEVNTAADINNCGSCNKSCSYPKATPLCVNGVCQMGPCIVGGYADCNMDPADGCERNLTTDHDYCGSCSTPCYYGFVCGGGMCYCPAFTFWVAGAWLPLTAPPCPLARYRVTFQLDRNGSPEVECLSLHQDVTAGRHTSKIVSLRGDGAQEVVAEDCCLSNHQMRAVVVCACAGSSYLRKNDTNFLNGVYDPKQVILYKRSDNKVCPP